MTICRLEFAHLAVAFAAAIGVLGCDSQTDQRTSDLEVMAGIQIDNITVLHPTSFGKRNIETKNDVTTLGWTQSDHVIRLERGKFTLNGNVHGLIDDEQILAVAEDGTVSIDGENWPPLKPSKITFQSVRFALEGQHGNVSHDNGVDRFIDMNGRKCELKDGQFTIDGRPYGVLEEADVVNVSIDGSITVNGEARVPQ